MSIGIEQPKSKVPSLYIWIYSFESPEEVKQLEQQPVEDKTHIYISTQNKTFGADLDKLTDLGIVLLFL